MKKFYIIFTLIFVTYHSSANELKKLHRKTKIMSKDFSINLKSYIGVKQRIVIQNVQVENSLKRYNFILDTGADTHISESLAKEMGLETVYQDSVTDGYSYDAVEYGLTNITLEGVEFENVVTAISKTDLGAGVICNIDGILGKNILRFGCWKFENGGLTFTDNPAQWNVNGFYKQKIKMFPGFLVFVEVGLGAKMRGDSFVDLGFNTLYSIQSHSFNRIDNKTTINGKGYFISTLNADDAYNNESEIAIAQVPEFNFGRTRLKKGKVKYENKEQTLSDVIIDSEEEKYFAFNTIGSEILNYYTIIIDYPGKRFYSKLKEEYQDMAFYSFGFSVRPVDRGNFRIAVVWENSSAYDQGIKPGSLILGLNGLKFQHQKSVDVCENYAEIERLIENNDQLTILLEESDGKQVEHILTKKLIL